MAFFDKLNDLAKNIGSKTNDAIETGKLNSKINAETSAADEDLKKIGAYYYSLFAASGAAVPEIMEFCQSAKAHYTNAAEAQAEIEHIKTESETAKSASAAPAPASGMVCPVCGKDNTFGTRFCCECGGKLEVPAAPAGRICPQCGAAVAPGLKFCGECGERMEE